MQVQKEREKENKPMLYKGVNNPTLVIARWLIVVIQRLPRSLCELAMTRQGEGELAITGLEKCLWDRLYHFIDRRKPYLSIIHGWGQFPQLTFYL